MNFKVISSTEAFQTYLLHGAQILSMFMMSFGVPTVIGLSDYGRYAALFALPASVSVFVQGLFSAHLSTSDPGRFRSSAVTLNMLVVSGTLCLGAWFLDIWDAVALATMMAVMLERFRHEILALLANADKYTRALRMGELLGAISTMLFLGAAFSAGMTTYMLPVAILVVNQLLSIFCLARVARLRPWTPSRPSIRHLFSGGVSSMFVRAHEEIFITQAPLALSFFAGDRASGMFRVTVSVMKIVFKAFPFRYEKVAYDALNGHLEIKYILRFFVFVNVITAAIIAMVLLFGHLSPLSKLMSAVDIYVLSLSAGMALCCVFLPLFILRDRRCYIPVLAAGATTLLALAGGGIDGFRAAYLGCNVLICAWVIYLLHRLSVTDDKIELR